MVRAIVITGLVLAVSACVGGGGDSVHSGQRQAVYGQFGLELTNIDDRMAPGDDFYRYVNGKWLDSFEIPADRARYGIFTALFETSEKQVQEIIEEMAESETEGGSPEEKIADYYKAFMDIETIEQEKLKPAVLYLRRISEIRDINDLARVFGSPLYMSPVSGWVDIDSKNTDRYIFYFTQSGIGLPDRSYYLEESSFFKTVRLKYLVFLGELLEFAGHRTPNLAAKAILELETEMARAHWEPAKRRERDLTYNLYTRDELIELGGEFPVRAFLTAMQIDPQDQFILRETDAIEQMFALAQNTDLEVWKDYLTAHFLSRYASVLPEKVDTAYFDFYRKTLTGQPEKRQRWKRAVAAVEDALGEAVGQIYVQRHFPPRAKAEMDTLVANVSAAFERRLDSLEWMGEDTRAEAHDKLGKFVAKIGYPEEFENYTKLHIKSDKAFSNMINAREWAYDDMISQLGTPIDRGEWFMTPQTVNAYYAPNRNEIVFPAAILQPPFFDPYADPAVNYGAIGAVIGHEMGHGFDDQGSKSDGDGVLRNWWTDQDRESFDAKTAGLVEQYNSYAPIPDQFVNGQLTLGENIGDLGGLSIAYDAYHLSLNGQEPPVLDGLTGDQRFFMSWAQVWRALYREEATLRQLKSDPHSPPQYRVNGVVRNMDQWYQAFDVGPDNILYLPPSERVGVW